MATMTGENLLNSIIESTGVEINNLIFNTLSARLQQLMTDGTYSSLSAAVSMSAFSTAVRDATEIGELIDAVGTNADLIAAAAEGEVDAIVFPPIGGGVGNTINLTTGDDVVGPAVEDEDFQSTDLDDTINGVSSALASEQTLNPADEIAGGAGTDTLSVTVNGDFTGFTGDGGLNSIENIELLSNSIADRTFNAAGISGVEQYNIDGTNHAVQVTNLGDLDAVLGLRNQTDDFTPTYAAGVTDGGSDVQSLAFDTVGTEDTAVTVTIAGVETLDVDVTGENYVDFTAAAATDMVITGAGNLTTATGPAALKTLDAEAAEGDLDIDLGASTDATEVLFGAGDDTLTVAPGDITKAAILKGGDGEDTLVTSITGTVQYKMEEIETVKLGNADGLTFSAAEATGITGVQASTAMAADATFSSLGTGDLTVDLQGANATAPLLILDHSGATTLNVNMPAAAATVAVPDVNDVGVTLSNSTDLDVNVAEKMDYEGTVTADKATGLDVNILGETSGAAAITAGAASTVGINAVENDSVLVVTANEATKLTVSADADLDLSGGATNFDALQQLEVATEGDFDMNGIALGAVSSVQLAGAGSVDLGALGATDLDTYGITVAAVGLSGDESAASQSLEIFSIDTKGQNIQVDAGGVLGDVTIGAIDAGDAGAAGDVIIDLDGIGGDFNLDTIFGKNVIIDASGALGEANNGTPDTYSEVTLDAGGSLDFTGINLNANIITGIATGTKDVSMTFAGGIDDDTFTVSSTGAFTGDLAIDATGNIQATGGADTLVLDGNNSALDVASLDMSGIEAIIVDDTGGTVTVQAADITGKTFELAGTVGNEVLTVQGGATAETIDLSNVTIDATAGDFNVLGSAGADTITASAGIDVFTYTAANQFDDTIKDFDSGVDAIWLDVLNGTGTATATAIATTAMGTATTVTATATIAMTGLFSAAYNNQVTTTATGLAGATSVTSSASVKATTVGLNLLNSLGSVITFGTGAVTATPIAFGATEMGTYASITAFESFLTTGAIGVTTGNATFVAFGLIGSGSSWSLVVANIAGNTDTAITSGEYTVKTIAAFDAAVVAGDIFLV